MPPWSTPFDSFRTDLFDATAIACCRMYQTNEEIWSGLSKNTHEGLGSPARIVPATLILFGGQVLPFLLLAASSFLSRVQFALACAAAICALLPRIVGARRFQQSYTTIILHPVGVLGLLTLQWMGLLRWLGDKPVRRKGRAYPTTPASAV